MVAPDSDTGVTRPVQKPDRKRLAVVLAVVVVAGAVLWFANRPSSEPAVKTEREVDLALVEFRNDGFSIELPENWVFFEQERKDPQIPMVAGAPGTQNNVRVRVSPLEQPIVIDDSLPESEVVRYQAEFDKFIDQGEGVEEVIQRQRVRINGVQGFHYLYTFKDEVSGEKGFHSHFFLLGGPRLYTIVFQALPASNYGRLAGTFDRILASFKLLDVDRAASPSPAA